MDKLSDARMRDQFLGWQCRIRAFAMRQDQGRPSPGMRPRVFSPQGAVLCEALTVVLVPHDPAEHTAFFRFQVQKTADARIIYEKGLQYLQATYFQKPTEFSDEMTALFPPRSALAADLAAAGEVLIEFEQFSQTYRMMADIRRLATREAVYQHTLWHNRLFNPELPNGSVVLGLRPQWRSAQAHPGA